MSGRRIMQSVTSVKWKRRTFNINQHLNDGKSIMNREGQVQQIFERFNTMRYEEGRKVLRLYGSPGVGKTAFLDLVASYASSSQQLNILPLAVSLKRPLKHAISSEIDIALRVLHQ